MLFLGFALAAAVPAQADTRPDYEAAIAAIKQGKRDQAIALLTKVIDSKELSGETLATMHYMRADLYSQLAKLDESVADYSKAIEIMPDHAAAFHDRAVVYAQMKKYTEALDDLARAQFLVPNSPLPYFNRGRVYETMGKRNEAIQEYRRARALAPKMKEPQEALRRLGVR
jgi:tetratricopeptide (TPR) repeat protein